MRTLFQTFTTFIAIFTFTAASAFAATKIGVVGASNPNVTAVSEAGESRTLQAGDDVFLNDKITTTAKGSAQLMFLDKSALTVSPNSSITVDTFVYNPTTKDGTMSLQSAKGAFRFIGGALTKKKPVKIKTPVSTIGIRGGIVDTHIANSGKTDAIFIFGKEMTLTNQNGQTSSTTDFGTGLSLTDGNGVPQDLPKGAIINLISNSPVNNAADNAQTSNDGQEVDNKVNINTKPKTEGNSNNGASNTKSDSNASGNNAGNNNASNNSDGNGNNQSTAGDTPPAKEGSANNDGPSGAFEPVETAGDKAVAPEGDEGPAPQGNAFGFGSGTNPDGPDGPAVFGGPEGAGGPDTATNVAGTIPTGENAQEELREGVNDFVLNQGAGNDENDRPLFDFEEIKDRFADNERFNDAFGTGENNNGDQPPLPPTVDDEPPVDEPIEEVCLGCACTNSCTAPPPARINTDNTLAAPTLTGFYGNTIRANGTDTVLFDDGGEMKGEIIGSSPNTRFFFELTGETPNVGADIDDVEVKAKNPGTGTLSPSEIGYWDDAGEVTGWMGKYLVTADEAFAYYELKNDDGTDTQSTRMIILDSDLLTNSGAGYASTTGATAAIDSAITESAISPLGTNGVIAYEFLPDLMAFGPSGMGFYRYGVQSHFGANAFGFANKGLLVDYRHEQFMGGFINFAGSNPSMSLSVGQVNPDFLSIDGGGIVDGGQFMVGSTYTSEARDFDTNSNIQTDEFTGRNGNFSVDADTLAYKDSAASDDVISGFMVESTLGLNEDPTDDIEAHQGLVATNSGASFVNNSISGMAPSTTLDYKGFTAGLIMKNSGEVSRIKSVNPGDVDVDINKLAAGSGVNVSATINTVIVDDTGTFGSSHDNNFGGNTLNSSVIETTTYGAQVTTAGRDGAIAAMDNYNNDVAVCASCNFAHWGVWSTYHDGGTPGTETDDVMTGLVPYVAGEITPYVAGTAVGQWDYDANANTTYDIGDGPGLLGTVVYSGDIAANTIDAAGNIANATGTFASTIDLANRRIQAYNGSVGSFNFGFNATNGVLNGVNANSLAAANTATVTGVPTGGYDFNGSTNTFNAEVVNTGGGGLYDVHGNINGALFGPSAEEVGGNFYIQNIGGDNIINTGDDSYAGGVFIGDR